MEYKQKYTKKQKLKYYENRIKELEKQIRECGDIEEMEELANKFLFCVRRRRQIEDTKERKGA